MKYKILIIEDNPENYYLMRYLLESRNYIVMGADNGPHGISLAQEQLPDCILLDIQLPQMDGYSVAKALRADHSLDKTPIIAVTSYAMPGDKEMALAAGASAYIEKPIDPESFVDQVEENMHSFSHKGAQNENTNS